MITANGKERNVTSLALGINNVYAFAGIGGYWGVNSTTNRTDGTVRNEDAIGIAIDNLSIGAVMMLDTTITDPGVFFAVDASLDRAGFVGVGDILTAEVRDLTFQLNQVLSVDMSVVDFSRSTYRINADGTVEKGVLRDGEVLEEGFQLGYFLDTGDVNNPIILEFNERLIRIQGEAEFNLLDIATFDGRLLWRSPTISLRSLSMLRQISLPLFMKQG